MRSLIVIPVRFGSSRFPGKPLVSVAGKPLIRQVWERARQSRRAERIVIATDDERIRVALAGAGAEVTMTAGELRTGTDRMAWVAERYTADAYLNLQGDELIGDARILDDLIDRFEKHPPLSIGTLMRPITDPAEVANPHVVKVVTDQKGDALYFSRAAIPFDRDRVASSPTSGGPIYKHLGIYIYRKDALMQFASLPTGPLEEREKLEQLRALENGIRIRVWETPYDSIRIDSPEDIGRAERLLSRMEMKSVR